MAYLSTTPEQQRKMLSAIGVSSVAELFEQIPAELQLHRPLAIPPALTELELESHLRSLAQRNVAPGQRTCFLGGGAYDHFIPAAVDTIAGRSEFYTAYTPYQAEASQGSLQTFFEFQSLICQLTGMDVSNASLYEGGTAISEAIFLAQRVTGRLRKVVFLGSVHPEYRQVSETYLRQLNCELITIPVPDGRADLSKVAAAIDDQTAALVIQQPNFFGGLESVRELTAAAQKHGALAIVSYDPLSLGVLQKPGDYGADIAVAAGQSLGIPLQYGGPYLGLFSCREAYMRKMPGRLIGETVDRLGRRCFSLNLQAREQHIRREKATSNICTNQGLMAIRATTYLCLLGPQGLRELAELCCQKAHYLADRLRSSSVCQPAFPGPFFKEFAVKTNGPAKQLLARARTAGFDIGPELTPFRIPGVDHPEEYLLVAVTEKRTRAELDALVDALQGG